MASESDHQGASDIRLGPPKLAAQGTCHKEVGLLLPFESGQVQPRMREVHIEPTKPFSQVLGMSRTVKNKVKEELNSRNTTEPRYYLPQWREPSLS